MIIKEWKKEIHLNITQEINNLKIKDKVHITLEINNFKYQNVAHVTLVPIMHMII